MVENYFNHVILDSEGTFKLLNWEVRDITNPVTIMLASALA